MNTHLLFCYGTLMRGHGNHRLLEDSRFVGERRTVGGWTLALSVVPYLVPARREDHVEGELYEVDDDTLARVDRLEGHPHHYCRSAVRLTSGEAAWAYVGPASRILLALPRGPRWDGGDL